MTMQHLWRGCVVWLLACGLVWADPTAGVLRSAQALRKSDLEALVLTSLPPSRHAGLEEAFRDHLQHELTAADRAEFDRGLARLLSDDGVDSIMLELQPQLDAFRPQLAMMLTMGISMAQTALDDAPADATEAQLQQTGRQALDAVQQWALATDFTDPQRVRTALNALAKAARRSGVTSMDELQQMPFEDVLAAGSVLLVGVKQAARAFDLDLDAIAASTRARVLQQSARTATVQTTIDLFGSPVSYQTELVAVDGGWYNRDMVQ